MWRFGRVSINPFGANLLSSCWILWSEDRRSAARSDDPRFENIKARSVLQTPMQHVPREDEPNCSDASQGDQDVTHASGPPLLRTPGANRTVDSDQRSHHSKPSHELDEPKPDIAFGA